MGGKSGRNGEEKADEGDDGYQGVVVVRMRENVGDVGVTVGSFSDVQLAGCCLTRLSNRCSSSLSFSFSHLSLRDLSRSLSRLHPPAR